MSYLTRQSVREEAGFQDVETEALIGVVNNSNKVFAVNRRPIVDRNEDDLVTVTGDFVVMVDGMPVPVEDVDENLGTVELVTAPANETEVSIEYASSALPNTYIDKLIVEAEAIVNSALRKFTTVPLSEDDTDNYATARRIALMYASGFALVRDYGKNTDTEESAKDGYAKLAWAKKALDSLIATIKDNGDAASGGGTARVVSEGHVFGGHRKIDTRSHDFFMRKEC